MTLSSILNPILRAGDAGYLPDWLIRLGIRRLLRTRRRELLEGGEPAQQQRLEAFVREARQAHVAEVPELANQQHYEVPTRFFESVLGPQLKYSCCYWPAGVETLADAESAALRMTCERAELADGMDILELGCGWGSLSLWMAREYPGSRVTAVSNSSTQKAFIEQRAAEQGLDNLRVITADMNDFSPGAQFDRVLSVEMFEHMRNHEELMRRVSEWLTPTGRLFVHVFCHKQFAYPFEARGPGDWMARHFFSGGMMPSDDLLPSYDRDLKLVRQWRWNGSHYARTCNAWLAQMDERSASVRPVFESCCGPVNGATWFQRWRIFFMACAELFAFGEGEEWYVSHYLFERQSVGVGIAETTGVGAGALGG